MSIRSAELEESLLQSNIAILLARGYKPLETETLEEFVEKHKDILEEYK